MSRGRRPQSTERLPERNENSGRLEARQSKAVANDGDGNRIELERSEVTAWMGALPHPDDLEQYNRIINNGAERLMVMLEKEQSHRHELDKHAVPENFRVFRRGQLLGASLSFVAVITAAILHYLGGSAIVSTAILSVPVLAVAKALVDSIKNHSNPKD